MPAEAAFRLGALTVPDGTLTEGAASNPTETFGLDGQAPTADT